MKFQNELKDIEKQLNHHTGITSVRGKVVETSEIQSISQRIDRLKPITDEEKSQHALLRIWVLSALENYSDALPIFDKNIGKISNDYNQLDLLIGCILELASTLRRFDRITEAISVVEKGEESLKKVKEHDDRVWRHLASIMKSKGTSYWQKGEYDEAFECWQETLQIEKKLGDKDKIAKALINLGILFRVKGEYKSALEYYKEALATFRELEDKKHIGIILNNIGILYREQGNLDLAFNSLKECLTIWEELGDKYGIVSALHNIGEVLQYKGDLIGALEYHQQGLLLHNEVEINKKDSAQIRENIGQTYFSKGELSSALEHYQYSLQLREEIGHEEHIGRSYNDIGLIYQAQGNYISSLDYFTKALEIKQRLGNEYQIAQTLYNLVILTVEHDELEEAKIFLNQLATLDSANRVISQLYRLATGIILVKSTRLQKRVTAQNIFHAIASEEIVRHDLTIFSMLNLTDLLLDELQLMEGEEEILREIKELTKKLLEIAKGQYSFSLLVQTYLLQSKLSLIELDVHKAESLLTQARLLAEEKALWQLVVITSNEVDILRRQMNKWNDLIKRNASFLERIELAQVNQIIKGMLQKRVEDVSALPQFAVNLICVSLFKLDNAVLKLILSESLPYTKSDSELLMKMGLFYTFSLKQGQSMEPSVGLFGPLPIPTVPDHIGITYTFSILDPKRTSIGSNNELYAVIVFSLPRSLEHFFKDREKISQILEKQTKRIKTIDEVTLNFLQSFKYQSLGIEQEERSN